MSGYYLDASALVKRYVDETGSDWLRVCRLELVAEQGASARASFAQAR